MKKIWERSDPEGKHLLLCFLTVLALTLFARAFAGTAQAQVTVAVPQERILSGTFFASGTLTPLGTKEYPIVEGLVITDTAEVGTDLEPGEPVALVDPDALEELLIRVEAEATQLELRIEALLVDNTPSRDAVTDAEDAVSDAKALKKECQAALESAQEALEQAAEEEKAAHEAAVRATEQELESAKEALAEAQKQLQREEAAYAEAKSRAKRDRESNEAEASVLQLDLDRVKERLEDLEAVRDAGYAVTAPQSGALAEITAGSYSMTNPYGGNLLTFTLDAEDAELLNAGMKVTISREEQTAELYGCTVVTSGEMGTTFQASVLKTGWEPGKVSVSGNLWEEEHNTCVPVEALRRDSGGYFLFVLDRRADLWRIEQTVRKVYVSPERLDGAWAAVSGLEPGKQVVVTSSKPLTEGSRVRVIP